MEKTFIVRGQEGNILNKRSEIMGKCRHLYPHLLCNIDTREGSPERTDETEDEEEEEDREIQKEP